MKGKFAIDPAGEAKWMVMANGTLQVIIESGGLTAFEVINLDNGETVGGNVTLAEHIRARAIAEARKGAA